MDNMLVIKLSSAAFRLHYFEGSLPTKFLEIDNQRYYLDDESSSNNGFIGYFDWLRQSAETIVGIRMCFFEHHDYNGFLQTLPYVRSTFNGRYMEILFSDDSYNFDLSGDQDFANNYVYKSESQDYLFTFGLDHLTPVEFMSLIEKCKVMDPSAGAHANTSTDK